jgi:hypothetical protein
MSAGVTLCVAVLFFVLSPNVLLRLPPKGGKFLVAGVHAIIFALIFHFTHKLVWQMTDYAEEGFKEGACNTDTNKCGIWNAAKSRWNDRCCEGTVCTLGRCDKGLVCENRSADILNKSRCVKKQ